MKCCEYNPWAVLDVFNCKSGLKRLDKQTDRQMDRQTYKWTDRQTDEQMNR